MNNIKRINIGENINFTYIHENKFKTTSVSVLMLVPSDKQYVSRNSLIPNLLAHSCKKYPSLLSISKKLEELYGASVHPGVSVVGDNQILSLSIHCINDSFIPDGSNNVLESSKLLCDLIFDPDVSQDSFEKDKVDMEKRQLIEEIESELSNKKAYALRKCKEIMCKDEPFGINPLGSIEDVKKIDEKIAFNTWKRILKSAKIEVIMTGSGEYEPICEEIKERFSSIERENIFSFKNSVIKKASHVTEATEAMDIIQCKLVMGFRTETANPDEDVEAVKVMNAILGGTPQSKLFSNVREKLSLCYYCSSRYNEHKGIIFIESGVEKDNVFKAKEEILKQLKDIQLGNFTDKELEETKLFLTQSIEKVKDSVSRLNSWYASQILSTEKKSPEETIEKINSVSREKVISTAKKITLDTVYILKGKEN